MDDKLFAELIESVEEGGRILKGEIAPSRKFHFSPLDIKGIRTKVGKTQKEFASMIGVKVTTLRNWEQGKRNPSGPAMALLKVASYNPSILEEALT